MFSHSGALSILGLLVIACFLLALCLGTVVYTPAELLHIILGVFDRTVSEPADAVNRIILLDLRLSRLTLAILVGASLAGGGAAMQGLFRNPLADPMLTGVSAGAASAAIVVIVLGLDRLYATQLSSLPVASFIGSLLVASVVYLLSYYGGHTDRITLVLAGIAFNALAAAVIGFFTVIADNTELRSFTFWMLGSLSDASWIQVGVLSVLVIPSLIAIFAVWYPLNTFALGERNAMYLGVRVERLKLMLIVAVSMCVGASVAVVGMIAFVGLIAPHLVRITVGANHKLLLPASMLLGALIMLIADLVSRTAMSPVELPISVITALIGAPLFLFLIRNFSYGRV